jgi:hypothetical protein
MGKILDRNKFKAERSGVFAQEVLTAAKMFLVEDPQELRIERATITKHGKEDASKFVSCGGNGRRGTESCAETTKICANTPLLSALNLFLSRILPIQFLRPRS